MLKLLIGYVRVSTDAQDLTAQRDGLQALGVQAQRIYVDHGLTGTHRDRPGLREALAACRAGDTLVVTKLDRLARSLPDARDIADDLTRRNVRLNLGGSVYDPTDPVGRLLFNMLAMVAEFERHAARGMTLVMPRVRLCRLDSSSTRDSPGETWVERARCRHNHTLTRKANSVSGGSVAARARVASGAAVRASARSARRPALATDRSSKTYLFLT